MIWIAVSSAIAYACNGLMYLFKKWIWMQYVVSAGMALPMWAYCLVLLNNLSFEMGARKESIAYFMMAYGAAGIAVTVLVRKRWKIEE